MCNYFFDFFRARHFVHFSRGFHLHFQLAMLVRLPEGNIMYFTLMRWFITTQTRVMLSSPTCSRRLLIGVGMLLS